MSSPNWPPTLTVEIEPVLKLFTGENFYSSADAAIREAVLNSIDASSRRKEVEPEIKQSIQVIFDTKMLSVTVIDNGIGMDQDDLEKLFTKVGASASKLVQSGSVNKSIGEFGIGTLSYFLVCEKYQIHTHKAGSAPVSLEFSKTMLDGKTSAQELKPVRDEVGTTLVLFCSSQERFELLKNKFSHWMRNVQGLDAGLQPEGTALKQGGLTRDVRQISDFTKPDWVDSADLGPAEKLDVWDHYDGKGRVDVLYRGVFVERIEVEQLWGLEGAIHVDPKHFRPKLNREGFVGESLKNEVTPFLRSLHPKILKEAISCISELLSSKESWSIRKAITLWLAIPRSTEYREAAEVWDDKFRDVKAFRLMDSTAGREVSIAELISLKPEIIYLAPDEIDQANPVIGQAIRVLRAQGQTVVQGLQRDGGYLAHASVNGGYTSWLLLHSFRKELPQVKEITSIAESVVDREAIAEIYSADPKVKLLSLGSSSAPFVSVREEIWINIDSPSGKEIIEEICTRNEGHLGLWVACMKHSAGQAQWLEQVGRLIRKATPIDRRLGLVHRQYLRKLIEK